MNAAKIENREYRYALHCFCYNVIYKEVWLVDLY